MTSGPLEPGVTRSSSAFTASAAGRVAGQRLAQPSGWWGMVLFLCAEATLFGTLISSYFYLDFDAPRWPPAGIEPPLVTGPSIATAVLVVSTVFMWLAARAARAARRGSVVGLISFATVVQIGYLIAQTILFIHDYDKFKPQGSAYGSIYFTLLAADHAHVLFGVLLNLAVVAFVIVRGLTNYWLVGVRALAVYWYVVSAITVLVLLTQLSPSL